MNTLYSFVLIYFSPIYDAYCQSHYANGHCDYGCNNAECNWDGLDCEREPPKIAEGAMRLILRMDYHQLLSNLTSFLREVSRTIKMDKNVYRCLT